ncbi:hypothetical protein GQ55_8G059100 [Panicum hallii var. hallii]|uniref:Secreted protein n=1 Tax=Panicum hallii var. hallii TaxID=1504633 RepID=A0A2T7CL56_9POAL|nr:hypothetical protein GQ55_8G059100 [Panicum hallii var. hallii]
MNSVLRFLLSIWIQLIFAFFSNQMAFLCSLSSIGYPCSSGSESSGPSHSSSNEVMDSQFVFQDSSLGCFSFPELAKVLLPARRFLWFLLATSTDKRSSLIAEVARFFFFDKEVSLSLRFPLV